MATFQTNFPFRNPHVQILASQILRRPPQIDLRRQRITLPDGDFIEIDWSGPEEGPVFLLLPGLGGSSRSSYARGMIAALNRQGWQAGVVHARGASGEPNKLARSYHAGEIDDFDYVLTQVCRRWPHRLIGVIGYSLGGSALIHWLTHFQADPRVFAAAAVSVPFELAVCATRLNQGFSRLYQHHLLRCQKSLILRKIRAGIVQIEPDKLKAVTNFWEFDDIVTAPLHGFAGANDYYRRCSSRGKLQAIQTPTLLIHGLDDPFMTPAVVPDEGELSAQITFELSQHGGHVGFVYGKPWHPRYWLEERIPAYFKTQLR